MSSKTALSSLASETTSSLQPAIITIDGPAASGKSTVGDRLAERLGFLYFDTGIMYRAVTWSVLHEGIEPMDEQTVGDMAGRVQIDIAPPAENVQDGRQCTVLIGEHDITWEIRTPRVDQNVSAVAANGAVREALTEQQRRIARQYGSGEEEKAGIVMVGRDIGTVVVPDAPLKVYLNASDVERARRRYQEQLARVEDANFNQADFDQVLADMRRRDQRDSQRDVAPLRPADDAVVIDTTDLSADAVIEKILELMK